MYEDRIRHHWSKKCETGQNVNLELEAGKTDEHVMEFCRTRLEGVLDATGLSHKSSLQTPHQTRQDDQASAALKQEANLAQERRKLQVASNALKQKETATNHKIQTLKESFRNRGKKRPFNSGNGKDNKGWKNHTCHGTCQGYASFHEPNHKYHKGNHKGTGKGKGKFVDKW